ncbi:MAG: SIMPL domain-containing protein [Campylobacterota bacterium]
MKKTVVAICLTISSLMAFELDFSKKFSADITPQTAVTNINFSLKAEDEKAVTNRLADISTYINGYDAVDKKGGKFNVRPNYIYEDDKRVQEGFIGSMHYKISSDKMQMLDMFLEDLMSEKKNETINVNSYGYEVSAQQYQEALEKLRMQSILWSVGYSKELSNQVYKECEVKNISFGGRAVPTLLRSEVSRSSDKSFAPQPTKDDQSVSLTPSFLIECK